MATATYNSTTKSFSGGSASDRLTLENLASATGSPFTFYHRGLSVQSAGVGDKFKLAANSFIDLSGATLILTGTGASGGGSAFKCEGDLLIDKGIASKDFTLVYSDDNFSSAYIASHDQNLPGALFSDNAKIVCANGSKIVIKSALIDPPTGNAGFNILYIGNQNAASKLDIKFTGRQDLIPRYQQPAGQPYYLMGSCIIVWNVRAVVTQRDIDIVDAYIDFRPYGTSAFPTKLSMRSVESIKFTGGGFTPASPIIMGASDDDLNISISKPLGQWQLGLVGSSLQTCTMILRNLKGIELDTRTVYHTWDSSFEISTHLFPRFKVVNSANQNLSGVSIKFKTHDPVFSLGSTTSVTYPTAKTLSGVSDANGRVSFGSSDGTKALGVVGEAVGVFRTYGAYHPTTNANLAYALSPQKSFSVFNFGYTPIIDQLWSFTKSGTNAGGAVAEQTLTLIVDGYVTASSSAGVPTKASSLDDVYDLLHKYSLDNASAYLMSVNGKDLIINGYNIVFSNSATAVSITGTGAIKTLTIPANTILNAGAKFTKFSTDGTFTTNNVTTTFLRQVQGVDYLVINNLPAGAVVGTGLETTKKANNILWVKSGQTYAQAVTANQYAHTALSAYDLTLNALSYPYKLYLRRNGYAQKIITLATSPTTAIDGTMIQDVDAAGVAWAGRQDATQFSEISYNPALSLNGANHRCMIFTPPSTISKSRTYTPETVYQALEDYQLQDAWAFEQLIKPNALGDVFLIPINNQTVFKIGERPASGTWATRTYAIEVVLGNRVQYSGSGIEIISNSTVSVGDQATGRFFGNQALDQIKAYVDRPITITQSTIKAVTDPLKTDIEAAKNAALKSYANSLSAP
ncbi:MAG: hypothetical protein AAF403_01865 [Pseudomonadota bacterium]